MTMITVEVLALDQAGSSPREAGVLGEVYPLCERNWLSLMVEIVHDGACLSIGKPKRMRRLGSRHEVCIRSRT
jgi:hypothetical protein